jgi:hypothetical protein
MTQLNFDHSEPHSENSHDMTKSFLVLAVSLFLHISSDWTADDVYKWMYRALSITLLIMMLIINWKKVREVFKSK